MAVTTEELRVKLLDAKKAETELRSFRKELERTSGSTAKSAKVSHEAARGHEHVHRALGGLGTALRYGGGLLGISAVGYGLADITKGGIAAQEQQLLLQNALKQTGQTGRRHIGELNQAVTATTSKGGFGALEETEGLANFVRLTKSSSAAVKLNQEAITLARGAHEGYGQAIMQVSRIQTGQVGRLQRYLGIIQPVKYYVDQLTASEKKRYPEKVKEAELLDKEATAREANQRVLERYGGAVQAYNKSTAGSISNANNAFKRATEELGEKLLPVITEVAKGFGEVVTEAEKGEGIWKTVGHDASVVGGDLKEVWEYFEKNKGALKGLEVGLSILAGAWGTEKVLNFVKAIKELTIVSTISKLLGGAAGLGAAAEEAGSGVAAGLGLMAPELLAAAAAVGLIYEAAKHAEEIRHFFGLGGTTKAYVGPHGGPSTKANVEREAVQGYLANRGAFAREVTEQQRRHEAAFPAELQAIKVELHLDSTKAAEAIFHNPRASRWIAEATTAHVLKKKARE